MAMSTIAKCRKMQVRGKKIACMNRIRMSILKQMWSEQKRIMIQNLNQLRSKKKESMRKRRISKLIRLDDEVRDYALKTYYHFCKENAARAFIEWRI